MAIATEAGYVVPMAVLKSSGISAEIEYRPVFAAEPVFPSLPIAPTLGSRYSPSCFIDVENEVFEFDGQEIVFDNGTNQLAEKAPGGI